MALPETMSSLRGTQYRVAPLSHHDPCKVTEAGPVITSGITRRVSGCITRASGGRPDTRRQTSGMESGEGRMHVMLIVIVI